MTPCFLYYPQLYNAVITLENEAMNLPFSLEVKLGISKLRNYKTSGVDNVINDFFQTLS